MKHRRNPKVDRIFAAWNKPGSPGFALAVSKAGKIVYRRGYGTADLDHDITIAPATVFHACSLAKQFTALCIMLLVAKRRLALTDKVHHHVPELGKIGAHITIADMLHHVSGIRDQWVLVTMAGWRMSDDVVTTADVLDLVQRMQSLNFHPGSDFSYSNTNYTLAGLIVERVSGERLCDFARKHIFLPLGMKNTTITGSHDEIVKNRAYGYRAAGKAFEIRMPNYNLTGPTNLLTTVEDLIRWTRNFESGVVGGKAALVAMTTAVANSNGYGLGLIMGSDDKGRPTIEHSGQDAGYRSHLMLYPDDRLAVALLGNVLLERIQTGDLVRKVAAVFLKPKRAARRRGLATMPAAASANTHAVAPAPPVLRDYVGLYHSEEIDSTYEVVLEGSSLRIRRRKYDPSPLHAISGDAFRVDNFSNVLTAAIVKFSRGAHRKVDGFRIDDATPSPNNRLADFRFTRLL